MATLVELIRGTEAVRDRATPSTASIEVTQSRYAAGTKTLMVSAEVSSSTKGTSRYSTVIVFQGVEAADKRGGAFRIPFPVDGQRIFVEHPSASKHHVRVRCGCTDYTHTWAWWNNKNGALFGAKYPPYSRKTDDLPERNAAHKPGLCKHLLAVFRQLRESGIVRA